MAQEIVTAAEKLLVKRLLRELLDDVAQQRHDLPADLVEVARAVGVEPVLGQAHARLGQFLPILGHAGKLLGQLLVQRPGLLVFRRDLLDVQRAALHLVVQDGEVPIDRSCQGHAPSLAHREYAF